jgi:hypothetical protein
MSKTKTDITPQQLRDAAEQARQLDEFIDKCNRDRLFFLIGFDLPWLAEQFEDAAVRVVSKQQEGGYESG